MLSNWMLSPASRRSDLASLLCSSSAPGIDPRQVTRLTAPGLDVIGGGAPDLPGIMQGHTDRFAFGRTYFHTTSRICSSSNSTLTIPNATATTARGSGSTTSTSRSP